MCCLKNERRKSLLFFFFVFVFLSFSTLSTNSLPESSLQPLAQVPQLGVLPALERALRRVGARDHRRLRAVDLGVPARERGVDRRELGARERDLLWQVLLPAASPQIITGLQVALPIALIVAIVAEMMMGGYGMGGAMIQASRMADSRGVFAGIVEISIVGWIMVKLMAALRTRLLAWHAEGSRDRA